MRAPANEDSQREVVSASKKDIPDIKEELASVPKDATSDKLSNEQIPDGTKGALRKGSEWTWAESMRKAYDQLANVFVTTNKDNTNKAAPTPTTTDAAATVRLTEDATPREVNYISIITCTYQIEISNTPFLY